MALPPRVLVINPSGEEALGVLEGPMRDLCAIVDELATRQSVELLAPEPPSESARIVESLPCSSQGHDCLIVLGSPRGVLTTSEISSDDLQTPPELIAQMEKLVRDFHRLEKPVLGICLGAQVVARTFGGSVYKLPKDAEHTALPAPFKGGRVPANGVEFGFHSQDFFEAAELDPVVGRALRAWRADQAPSDLAPKFQQWHSDTFQYPAGAVQLSTRKNCPAQAFRLGHRTYAFQYHIEVGRELANDWYHEYAEGTATHASCGADDSDTIDTQACEAQLEGVSVEGNLERAEAFTTTLMRSLLEDSAKVREKLERRERRLNNAAVVALVGVLAVAVGVATRWR